MNAQSWRAPKQEIPQVNRRRGSGVVGLFTRHHGIPDTHALLFQTIEQPPSPDELRGKNAEREHDRKPTRPGSNNHHDSQDEQREPDQHLDEPLRLQERIDQHLESRFTRTTRARGRLIGRLVVRCGSSNYVSACTPISIVKSLHSTEIVIRARTTVDLGQASARAAALRAERLPQMEGFRRESGNTGPHACAIQSKI
jgi:hypothetical protein